MHTRQIAQLFWQGKVAYLNLWLLLAASLSVGLVSPVLAAPEDGVVRAGSAQISAQGTTTTIQQSSQRAVIDWRGFSISRDELVQFMQPSASSATLNRVTGNQLSLILGRLDANGQVLLINPNGIIFGAGSQINVGSLIASTANIDNDNFMQGNLIFDQPGLPGASVINAGSITAAQGGLVALVAPHVRNDGLIQARLGKVMLGSADTFTIDLYGDGLINLALSDASLNQLHDATGQPVKSLITQAGIIDVGGGQAILVTAEAARGVLDSLINMSGTILADSAVEQGGRILLLAKGGNVDVSGNLSAQGTSGGQIEVLGDQVHLASTAQLNASGSDGGGILHIGGAYQGSGDTYRAQTTQVDSGALLNASATNIGNAGEVIVWSDGSTRYAGSILARGGAQGGDGGTVEVSGKQTLSFTGYVDAGASYGNAGSLLLDPTNFNIGLSEAGLISLVLSTGTSTAVSASGDINVNSVIDGRGRLAGGGLTLTAGNNVNVNDFIITNNGAINLFATAGTVNLAAGKVVSAGTAPITVRSGATLTNAPYLTSGLLSLISTLGSVNIGMGIDSSIGNLLIQAALDVDIEQPIVSISDGNSVTINAGNDIIVNAQIDGRPAFGVNPNGMVAMTAGQNIDLNQSIVANSIALTASAGTINAPTLLAGAGTAPIVTIGGDGIPLGIGLFSGNGPISVTTGGDLSSGIYVSTGPVSIRSTGGDVTVDTKLAEILGNVSIKADSGSVNVDQEIANIRSGSDLLITAGTDINLNQQIDALGGAAFTNIITPVPGGSVTFVAGNNVNLNRDLATNDGPVDITATTGTLNIAWNNLDGRTYRIQSGSAPISVTTGGNLTTGEPLPVDLHFAPCGVPCTLGNDEENATAFSQYIGGQLNPWVAFDTTGKLSLTSTGGDVTVDAPLPGTTGAVDITAANAVVVNNGLNTDSGPINISAGPGGITVNDYDEDYYGPGFVSDPPSPYFNSSGPPASASIDAFDSSITMTSVGNVTINTSTGIAANRDISISTQGKIIKGFIGSSLFDEAPGDSFSGPSVTDKLVLNADLGIDSFNTGGSRIVEATSSAGSISIGVFSPTQLTIDAAVDVFTGGFLGNMVDITAGNDINLTSVALSGIIKLDAGNDANLDTFTSVTSLDVTAGQHVVFNNADNFPVVAPDASIWLNGGDLKATSTDGNITFNDYSAIHITQPATGSASVTLNAYDSVTLRILETMGPVSITAKTGDITLLNDIGPPIIQDANSSTPYFDPTNIGVASLILNAGNDINMQGAKALGVVSITSGGTLTPTKGIYSGTADQLTINATGGALEKISGGPDVFHTGPYNFTGTFFGNIVLGSQVQLERAPVISPVAAPGPPAAAPGLPGALTALAAQTPNLSSVSASGTPGASGASSTAGSDSQNATLNASGNGELSEIIPEDEGTVFVGQSEDIQLVFEGGRGAAQTLDVGLGGQADVDDALGDCGSGKDKQSKAGCK